MTKVIYHHTLSKTGCIKTFFSIYLLSPSSSLSFSAASKINKLINTLGFSNYSRLVVLVCYCPLIPIIQADAQMGKTPP